MKITPSDISIMSGMHSLTHHPNAPVPKEDRKDPRDYTLVISEFGKSYDVSPIISKLNSEYIRIIVKEVAICAEIQNNATGFGMSSLVIDNVNAYQHQYGDSPDRNLLKSFAYYIVNAGDMLVINSSLSGRAKSDLVISKSQLAQNQGLISFDFVSAAGAVVPLPQYVNILIVFMEGREL